MGSIAHHYPVPGRLHGECSEGTSCLGLTTSVYRQTLQERYSMVRFIAQGGFGKVFLARHCATGMQVAMKKLTKTGARAASILSEVGLLKDLQHPNITQLLEVIETEHRIYLVLEYVDGVNLRKEICRSKKNRLREKEAQRIFADILGAVDYCHKRGIVHGDLKPDNVLIDTKGRAKICDFGLGIRCLPGQEVTAVGGTLAYYAPERLSRRRYEGPPLDVWALGLTLYEMITGDRPFYGSESEMIGSILYGIIFYPRFISSNVKHLIIKMLSRDPTMRPTLQEVLKHRWLRNVRPPCPLEPPPVSIKRAVLSRMAKMGFNVLTVVDTLRRKEYNDIMATFLLLQSQALQGPVHEAAEEISWPLTGPAPSAPIPWRRASEPAPCTGRLFAGVKPRGGEQGGRGSQPPMTIQRTPTRSVSPQPGPASPLLSPQPGPAEPSLSPQPGPASPRLSPQPGPASPRLSPQPGPASPRLSPQPGPASPRLSPQPGPASPRLSPQPGPASPRLSPQPGPASPRLSPQPGPAEPSLSPQPGPAEPSLSPQPGPASPRLSPQPGPASPRLSPQPGPASPRLSPQPGPTSPSLSPQPGPASPRLSPQPGPASPRLSPQPGPASPRLSSQPGPASPRLSPQPGSASPCLSPQPGPASPRLSPQPDPPASSLSCQSGLGAPRSSSRSTSAPANSGRRSWKALKRSLTASLRALCCCCLPPSGHHRHKVAPTAISCSADVDVLPVADQPHGRKPRFRKVHEQMEAEIAHLKQENSILRDAVSSATNQLDRKQSAELNKLRQDYARLVHELTEKTGQLQQEEVQKKSAEQAATQVKVQLQEAERRWEEVQAYIRKRTAEHEAAQQDLQGKFVSKENEVQSLHSKLTDTLVSKQQLEQRLMQLMESEQKRVKKEESLQMQVQDILEQNEALKAQIQQFHSQRAAQTSTSVLAEELHKVIAEKDKQTKPTEDSLASEHDHLTRKEEELKERQYVEAVELEAKEVPKKLFPKVSVHSHLVLEFKLKEADETRTLLQLECDTYKSVLAETEGILQKLQKSVEEEENKWKVKVDELQKTIKQLRREREHLEMELEKAEIERSTYVTEVRELKDLLTELQKKLDDSYSEAVRQNEELNLESSEKETMSVSLNQTIAQLQQLLQAVNKQLTKEK